MRISVSRVLFRAVPLGLVVATTTFVGSSAAAPGVTPSHHADSLAPGDSVSITKTVETPPIPPNPDIVFLADTTGSMGSSIANVRTNAAAILNQIKAAQPTAQFAVAEYKDEAPFSADPYAFRVNTPLTGTNADVVTGIDQWVASGGGDPAEAWIGALGTIPSAIGFRPDSTRVVVMFGDAPSHDPSLGFTLGQAVAALQGAEISVIAISVPGGAGLNQLGQADAVTSQTGGTLAAADPDQVSAVILDELENLPAVVTPSPSCDDGVSVSFQPPNDTVTSGETVVFAETVTLAPEAPQGETVSCTVSFLVNGELPGPEFVQTIDIEVLDVTPPSATCADSVNPGGQVPTAGKNPHSGQNPDGFYVLTATDNVDPNPEIFLTDSGSGHVFGPYSSGQKIKYIQAGSGPTDGGLMGDSDIRRLVGTGDALVSATDASGNESAAVFCRVPAPPK